MSTDERSVIIPMSEYEELKSIKDKFIQAFDEKKTVLHITSVPFCLGGRINKV